MNTIQGGPEDDSPPPLRGISPEEACAEFIRRLDRALVKLEEAER